MVKSAIVEEVALTARDPFAWYARKAAMLSTHTDTTFRTAATQCQGGHLSTVISVEFGQERREFKGKGGKAQM